MSFLSLKIFSRFPFFALKSLTGKASNPGSPGSFLNPLALKLAVAGLFVGLLIFSFILTACSGNAIENPTIKPEAVERFKAAPDDSSGDVRTGALVFVRLPCLSCHALGGKGGGVGPELDHIGSNAGGRVPGVGAAQYIYHILTNPEDANLPNFRNTTMPSFATSASPKELKDLTAFLLKQQ